MRVEHIYKDEHTVVNALYVHGKYWFTRTYILDDDGFVAKQITVYVDGSVDVED